MAVSMSENMEKAYLRGFALKDAGRKWHEVEDQLALEGFATDQGERILKGAVSMQYSRARAGKIPLKSYFENRPAKESAPETIPTEPPQERASQEARAPYDEPDPLESTEDEPMEPTAEHDAREEHTLQTPPEDMTATMRAIAREVCEEILANAMHEKHIQRVGVEGEEVPPEPTTLKGKDVRGRKENRKYQRLTVGIDVVLAEKFTQEAKERGMSPGKLLDVILWNRYGWPTLSYMPGYVKPDSDTTALNGCDDCAVPAPCDS